MIRIVDLHKSFGETVVLDGFTLDVPEGSTTVLMGRSGAGKSVLLKQIVGLLVPDQGRVEIDGQVVHELAPEALTRLRQEIGYVFQFAALFDSLTCGDNVRMGLLRQGLDLEEVESRTAAALGLVGLAEAIDRHPAELSGGMRKRIGIARAVALRPRYILWDEPTTGLDPVTTATMDRLMMQVREELGVTSVVVSHDLKSSFTVADRVALLHEGRVREVGTVAEIQASEDPIVRQFIEGRPE